MEGRTAFALAAWVCVRFKVNEETHLQLTMPRLRIFYRCLRKISKVHDLLCLFKLSNSPLWKSKLPLAQITTYKTYQCNN